MENIPNTLNYMVSGYVIFTVVMVTYLASLYKRWQNLKNEQKMLEEMEKQ
jgi:hypothetical protein